MPERASLYENLLNGEADTVSRSFEIVVVSKICDENNKIKLLLAKVDILGR